MTNIASNVYNEYPPPPENRYWGLVKLEEVRTVCWRPTCVQPQCHVKLSSDCELAPVRDEVIRLNVAGQLGLGERCIVPVQGEEEIHLEVSVCQGVHGGWLYHEDNHQMKYIVNYHYNNKRYPPLQDSCTQASLQGDRQLPSFPLNAQPIGLKSHC